MMHNKVYKILYSHHKFQKKALTLHQKDKEHEEKRMEDHP